MLQLVRDGEYSKAAKALLSCDLAPCNQDTLQIMKNKHPQAPIPTFTPHPSEPPLQLSTQQVVKGIKSFKKGSALGPSGLRAEHLKAAITVGVNATKVEGAITGFINLLLAGGLPAEVAPYFCGAKLHGGIKKDGGIRPIAVGEVLRRITSKGAAVALATKAASYLQPLQLGVGAIGGCEALIHAIRQVLQEDEDT